MTTLYIIDVDAVTMITERIKGLLILAETQLRTISDMDAIEIIPLAAALDCLNDQAAKIVELLNAGDDLEQEGAQR